MAGNALNEQTSRFHLKDRSPMTDLSNVWMRKCVVSQFMSFAINSYHQWNIVFRVKAYHKKSSGYLPAGEYIKNLRSITRIGTIIKSEDKFFLVSCRITTILLNYKHGRKGIIFFFADQQVGSIYFRDDASICRRCPNIQHFAFSHIINIIGRFDSFEMRKIKVLYSLLSHIQV